MKAIKWAWFLPRNIAIGFILVWRAIISPLYGEVCRYYPSCSAYGLKSIQTYGLVRGGSMTMLRIMRCNPMFRGGVDEVPERTKPLTCRMSPHGFVLPAS